MIPAILRKLFGSTVRESETWKKRLALQADEFELSDAAEVIELHGRIDQLVAEKQYDLLAYLLTQVDPYKRVHRANGVLSYRESDFEPPVLRPWTVLDWHFPELREELSRIIIHGSTVYIFVDGEVVARFDAAHPVPVALSIERNPTILDLVADYTGLVLPWEEQIRMYKAIFEKVGQGWTSEINRPIAFAFK